MLFTLLGRMVGGSSGGGAGGDISDFLEPSDTGGYWNTQDGSTVLDFNENPAVPGTSKVYQILESTGIPSNPNFLRHDEQTFYIAYDSDRFISSDFGRVAENPVSPMPALTSGFLLMFIMKHTGVAEESRVECAWLDDHAAPLFRFGHDGANTSGVRFIGPSSAYVFGKSGGNDGAPHSYCISYNGTNSVKRFFDGALVSEDSSVDPSGLADWGKIGLLCGDRKGVNQQSTKLFVRDRPANEDLDVANLHGLLMADL